MIDHVRIAWSAGPLSGSVRVPKIDADAFVAYLVREHGRRVLRLTIFPD